MTKEKLSKVLSDLPSGKLTYTLRNDYMFKAVLQKNRRALKGLLCALLGYNEYQIRDIELLNPIELGKAVDDKTCILDLKLIMNNDTILNIEMQVNRLDNWPERSLLYLCRAFDHLERGADYSEIHTTMHISILDFHLPHLTPRFYSEFKMLNTINHEVYSDKIALHVLDLKVIEELNNSGCEPLEAILAWDYPSGTASESVISTKYSELYKWAKLFKATTWEELKQMAEDNEYIADTIVTYHELSDDEKIQMQCEARERYDHDKATYIKTGFRMGREEGERIGREEGERVGRAEGQRQGIERLSALISCLEQDGHPDLIIKAAQDEALRDKLFKQYHL
ncbi:MAG: Rpn family recombination-promoting nuclease/putative transposase [Lachnospiraceae bacterium]|nr:Rpn family recombination-promoting nuclease/putative transposase [Lachnospiraceae bacterium]